MSALVIYEETEEIVHFENGLPPAGNYPTYTYGYVVDTRKWYRAHLFNMGKANGWVNIDPDNNEDGPVPKTIRAMVLIAGG